MTDVSSPGLQSICQGRHAQTEFCQSSYTDLIILDGYLPGAGPALEKVFPPRINGGNDSYWLGVAGKR